MCWSLRLCDIFSFEAICVADIASSRLPFFAATGSWMALSIIFGTFLSMICIPYHYIQCTPHPITRLFYLFDVWFT